MVLRDEFRQIFRDLFTIGSSTDEDDGTPCFFDLSDELFEHFFIDNWSSDLLEVCRNIFDKHLLCGDIFRQLDSHDSRSLRSRYLEGIVDE